jgi:hypothetical protein
LIGTNHHPLQVSFIFIFWVSCPSGASIYLFIFFASQANKRQVSMWLPSDGQTAPLVIAKLAPCNERALSLALGGFSRPGTRGSFSSSTFHHQSGASIICDVNVFILFIFYSSLLLFSSLSSPPSRPPAATKSSQVKIPPDCRWNV